MLRKHLTVAFRYAIRHKRYALINIAGMAVGLATSILIMTWAIDELNFDRFNQNADSIYRLGHVLTVGGQPRTAPRVSDPMASAIRDQVPEIAAMTRMRAGGRTAVSFADAHYFESAIIYADSEFFDIFSIPLSSGDTRTALSRANTVIITREIATKYFGHDDPIGKLLRFDAHTNFEVTGLIEEVPTNSHFTFDFLCSYESLLKDPAAPPPHWGRFDTYAYFRVRDNADLDAVQSKITSIVDKNLGERLKARNVGLEIHMQPLTAIHLYSDFTGGDIGPQGSIRYVWMVAALALGVLLIGCINFVNLATASSVQRFREIGVRKTFGASLANLRIQFLTESALYSLASLVLALILIKIAAPVFGSLTGRAIHIDYFRHPLLLCGLILFAIVVGVLAGLYPAVWISRAKPSAVLKSSRVSGESRSVLRRVLVVGQYVLSTGLIIGTLIINQQINYMMNQRLGFDQEQVIFLRNLNNLPPGMMTTMRHEIASVPGVLQTSLSAAAPGDGGYSMVGFLPEEHNDETELMIVWYADEDMLKTMGLQMVDGRFFSRDNRSDSLGAMIINETAVRNLGWQNPVGRTIQQRYNSPDGPIWKPKTVIGVVKDFYISGLQTPIEPLCIVLEELPDWYPTYSYLIARISTSDVHATLSGIQSKWEHLTADLPFDYFFASDQFAQQYDAERRLGRITLWGSILAIFVACLGLYGMAAHTAERRTKEIGIRKVLGASTLNVLGLLLRDFVYLVVLSNIIAWPIAYYILNRWLQEFAYRTSVGVTVFVIAGVSVLVLAILVVSFEVVRASRTSPVKSLKYE